MLNRTDKTKELAVWTALRQAAEKENDVAIVADRVRTVEEYKGAKISNNIEVKIWKMIDERRHRGFGTKIA